MILLQTTPNTPQNMDKTIKYGEQKNKNFHTILNIQSKKQISTNSTFLLKMP